MGTVDEDERVVSPGGRPVAPGPRHAKTFGGLAWLRARVSLAWWRSRRRTEAFFERRRWARFGQDPVRREYRELFVVLAVVGVLVLSYVVVSYWPTGGPGPAFHPPAAGPTPVPPPIDDSGGPSPSPSPSPTAPPTQPPAPPPPPPQHPPARRPPPPPAARLGSFEAEKAVRFGGALVGRLNGASGGLGVFGLGAPNEGSVQFVNVRVATTRSFVLTIFYSNPDSRARYLEIRVNGGFPTSVRAEPTDPGRVGTILVPVTLVAKVANTVELGNVENRAPDLDRIVISEHL